MKTILVVDDDFPNLQVLNLALMDQGYQVFTAWNGRHALHLISEQRPDLIISDTMMPIMNGKELCRALQADPALQSIPIVLTSGMEKSKVGDECHYAAFLEKPFHLSTLFDLVRQLIGKADE